MALNFFQKTYRFFSALALMLFLSSVLLPAGVAAASLFCDMDMAAAHMSAEQCCDSHKTDPFDKAAFLGRTADCKIQQICVDNGIENDLQIEATVPQLPTDMAAVAIDDYHQRVFSDDGPLSSVGFQPIPTYSQSPLFLLNSTFLN